MPEQLISMDISSTAAANASFGEEKGLLVCRPGRSSWKWWITIPDGCYALVQQHGKDIEYKDGSPVWPAGFHWVGLFTRVANLVTKQSVVFDMPVKGCKTQDDVTVQIDISFVFHIMGDAEKGERPETVREFVYRVTPSGLMQQLVDAGEEAVRGLARSMMHTDVYGLRSNKGARQDVHIAGASAAPHPEQDDVETAQAAQAAAAAADAGKANTTAMINTLNTQFEPQGVMITDVIIENVLLPGNIEEQMSNKTMVIADNAQQMMVQEYELMSLRQNEEIQTLKQRQKEEQEKAKSEGDQEVAVISLRLEEMKAEMGRKIKQIQEDGRRQRDTVLQESELQVKRLELERQELLTKNRAATKAEAEQLTAECDKDVQQKLAECKLQVDINEAKAYSVMGEAEGKAAQDLGAKMADEINRDTIKVWKALSGNKDFILSTDTDKGDIIKLCDSVLGKNADLETDGPQKQQLLAEMMITQKNPTVMLSMGNSTSTEKEAGGLISSRY